MASPVEGPKDPQEKTQGPGDPHTQSQECYHRPRPPKTQIFRAVGRCTDQSVPLAHQLVGEVSTQLAPRYPGLGMGPESAQVSGHWALR